MKKSFITGLVILLPVTITIFLLSILFRFFTFPFFKIFTSFLSHFKGTFPFLNTPEILHFTARIFSLILIIIIIFVLGILGRWFIFKILISCGDAILMRIPLVKSIYHTFQNMIESFLSMENRKLFKYPLMIKFPSSKSYCIGFATGDVPTEVSEKLNFPITTVFVPTAPHPISGYVIFVPSKETFKVNMSNEIALKFTISCGIIVPEDVKKNS